jgi:hypothetical protein
MDMGNARVKEAVEAFDETVQLDLQFVRPDDSAVNRRIERRRVASCGENTNPFHLI